MNKEDKELLAYVNGGYRDDKIYGELSIFHGQMCDWFKAEVKGLLKTYYNNGCVQDLKIIKKYIQLYMERCLYKSKYVELCDSISIIKRNINEIKYTD